MFSAKYSLPVDVNCALPRVFVLGSSLTIHFGPHLEKALDGRFEYSRKSDTDTERAEDNLDLPRGASAGDSSMVLAYLRHRREHNPIAADILLLSCGLHDLRTNPATGFTHIALSRFEANLRGILEEAALMHLQVAWLRITPVIDEIHNSRSKNFHRYSRDVDAYNAAADRIMTQAGAEILDLHALCLRLLPASLIDHVHYDEPARRQQALFIAEQLQRRYLKRVVEK